MSQECSYKQILQVNELQFKIAETLRQIKQLLSYLSSETPLVNMSSIIYHYTGAFYQMALRDPFQSDFYYSQISQHKQIFAQPTHFLKLKGFDEVAVVLVDGTYENLGMIIYGNKTLLKSVGYTAEEALYKTIHLILPSEFVPVHDTFWRRFYQRGKSKVMEAQRILFVRHKNRYTVPMKVFVKPMYHTTFGYCFIGCLRVAKNMIFNEVDPPVPLSNVFMFLANSNGRITEISPSCETLIGMNQRLYQKISQYFEGGLFVYQFNHNLDLKNFDFSKCNSVTLSGTFFDTTILMAHQKQLDLENDELQNLKQRNSLDNEESDPKQRRHGQIFSPVQVKIVREQYGDNDLVVYYFFFTFVQSAESIHANIRSLPDFDLIDKQGAQDMDSINDGLLNYKNETGSQTAISVHEQKGNQQNSQNSESNFFSGGSVSSTNTVNFEELKNLEENIDYSKTPKSLALVKIIFNCLVIMILAIEAAHLGMNYTRKEHQNELIDMVFHASQNMLYLSQLSILVRNYINIDLKLEPNSSDYFVDRRKTVQLEALKIIEEMRQN